MSEVLLLVHVHAGEKVWNCWKIKICVKLATFWRSKVRSECNHSFSVRRRFKWCRTNCNRLLSSRFSTLHLFNWFRRFSRCLCFRILDLRADSRFDIMRRRFRSSIAVEEADTCWFGSDLSSEPELEETGLGEKRAWESSSWSHGVKPAEKVEKGSEGGRESMGAEWRGFSETRGGGAEEGEREEMRCRGMLFMLQNVGVNLVIWGVSGGVCVCCTLHGFWVIYHYGCGASLGSGRDVWLPL